MTNQVPSNYLNIETIKVELVQKHIYLGHEITLFRNHHICELHRKINLAWTTYGKLKTY